MNSSSRRTPRAGRPGGSRLAAVPTLLAASLAGSFFAPAARALPTGAETVHGSVAVAPPSVTPNGATLNIRQNTGQAIVNWRGFSIGANETVNISQPNAQSVMLNRVVGTNASVIAGRLNANGRVFLVNPAGVLFARGASVNVGSLVASTLGISNGDFLAGRYRFAATPGQAAASVVNQGDLTAGPHGTVALLGGQVSNSGTVAAKLGTVAFGAGADMTLDFAGDGLTMIKVDGRAAQALVDNAGLAQADGGQVLMSAASADALAGTVINQRGIVRARSVEARGGRIVLDGGANGATQVSGTLDATGSASMSGGRIDVTGQTVQLTNGALLDASGGAGGGTVRVGGGAGGQDATLANARDTTVASGAAIHANATQNGDGGRIVVYGTQTARVYGALTAFGGPSGGNGGYLETSGAFVDTHGAQLAASAPRGRAGLWLLDPADVLVVDAFVASDTTQILTGDIDNTLNQGTSVTIATAPLTGLGTGQISLFGHIAKTLGGDAVLTFASNTGFSATPFVTPQGVASPPPSIVSSAGKLDVVVTNAPAAAGGVAGAIGFTGTSSAVPLQITTNGGNFTAGATAPGGTFDGSSVSFSFTNVDTRGAAGDGDLTVRGTAAQGSGVRLAASNLATGAGTLDLRGVAAGEGGEGVFFTSPLALPNEPTTLTTTSGALRIYGSAVHGARDISADGVLLSRNAALSTQSGALDIRGNLTSTPGAPQVESEYHGVELAAGVSVTSNSGQISIAGSTDTSDAGVVVRGPFNGTVIIPDNTPIAVNLPAASVRSATGDIVLRAGNTVVEAGEGSASSLSIEPGVVVSSSGALALVPGSVIATSANPVFTLAAADTVPVTLNQFAPGLSLSAAEVSQLTGFETMVLGSGTHTGLITVAAGAPFAGNVTLANPGAGSAGLSLPAGISAPGHTVALDSAGTVTLTGPINANALLLAGPAQFTLTNPANSVNVLAAANAGGVNYVNAGALIIGPVLAPAFDSAANQFTVLDATNSSVTGDFRAQALTGGIQLGGGNVQAAAPVVALPVVAVVPVTDGDGGGFSTVVGQSGTGSGTAVLKAAGNGPTGDATTNLSAGGAIDLIMEEGVFTNAGSGRLAAGNGWRVWAATWTGEARGGIAPGNAQPDFYGCAVAGGCGWGGTVPAAGNRFVYVARPTVTVTADNLARSQGSANPALTFATARLINGDASGDALAGGLSTSATSASPAGSYGIVSGFSSPVGYNVVNVNGTLTVAAAPNSAVVTPPSAAPAATVDAVEATPAVFNRSGLQPLFTAQEQSFVYESNLGGINICVGSNQPVLAAVQPDGPADTLALEWKRVRARPNLNNCLVVNGQHGCSEF